MSDYKYKRLQVFISSTYLDMEAERRAAVEAILSAGHIPAGMELFISGDESQMVVIKKWIDESDVFLLILGAQYGSIEPKTKKSYTQLEYEYALNTKKPVFSCVISEHGLDIKNKEHGRQAIESKNPQKLNSFRSLVLKNIVSFWDNPSDIKHAIANKLSDLCRRDDLLGWVRPGAGFFIRSYAKVFDGDFLTNLKHHLKTAKEIKLVGICLIVFKELEYINILIERTKKGEANVVLCLGDPVSEPVVSRKKTEYVGITLRGTGDTTDEAYIKDISRIIKEQGGRIELRLFNYYLEFATMIFDDNIFIYPYGYKLPGTKSPVLHFKNNGSPEAQFFINSAEKTINESIPYSY